MESQLFGHRKGAFTGAERDHMGWFQQAHTGTLFLDEVGELTLDGQAKLLRILEGHPFLPVGATAEVSVDVRVIAATNRDLREYVREKHFREDLYYRLSVFELLVPPLRDRGSDIDMLVEHFLNHFRTQHGRPAITISPAARKLLLEYNWPGNVRQLRNVIDSAIVLPRGMKFNLTIWRCATRALTSSTICESTCGRKTNSRSASKNRRQCTRSCQAVGTQPCYLIPQVGAV